MSLCRTKSEHAFALLRGATKGVTKAEGYLAVPNWAGCPAVVPNPLEDFTDRFKYSEADAAARHLVFELIDKSRDIEV